jgi:lipopolysaccharide biosynthesis regulator YciM
MEKYHMDIYLQKLPDENKGNITKQEQLVNISMETIREYILGEMATAVEEGDRDAWNTLLDMTLAINDQQVRVDILNNLLIMPGHDRHQAITWEIQKTQSPSSIPYIEQMLKSGFTDLEYTCSENETITKWFSHALASIHTPEAIELIKRFSHSDDPGIAKEMAYRLAKIKA